MTTDTTGKQLRPVDQVNNIISKAKNKFLGIVNDENKFRKEANFALQICQNNDYLMKCATSNPQSLLNAVVNIASLGTSLNPAEKNAYLVPYGGKNTRVDLQISYLGLLNLAISEGAIMWAQANIVRETDDFVVTGLDTAPIHKYNPFDSQRGQIVGAYCVAKFPNGDYVTEIMSRDEIDAIMTRSQAGKSVIMSPWKTDYSEMARKTVVKRASKYWQGSSKLKNAIEYLNTDGGEGIEFNKARHRGSEIKNVDELIGDKVPSGGNVDE